MTYWNRLVRIVWVGSLWLVAGLGCAMSAPAKGAAAEPTPALTEHQIESWWAEYESEYLLDWYRSKGVRDPKWDAAAEAWLKSYGEKAARRTEPTPRDTKSGRELIDAGCTDPVITLFVRMDQVSSVSATRTQRLLLSEEAAALLDAADQAGCPPMRLWRTCLGMLRLKSSLGEDRGALIEWVSRLEDYLVRTVSQKDLPPLAERLIVAKFAYDLDQDANTYSKNIVEKLAGSHCSAWLRGVLIGEFHVEQAWERRGSGYANTVGDAGWQGFRTELEEAHAALTEAYAADPTRPEAPTRMINVLAGLGERGTETEEKWFRRALEAQIDYYPAYRARLWFLYPRWGGSHEKMMRVGEEAFRTGRFDTSAPAIYLEAVWSVCSDTDDFLTPFQKEENIQKLGELRAGYEKTPGPAADKWLSIIAHVYFRIGRPADANEIVTRLGDRFQKRWASFPRVTSGEFAIIHAYDASVRPLVTAADAAQKDGDFDKAESLLNKALAKVAENKSVKQAVERKLAMLSFRRAFEGGQWASLIQGPRPLDLFDETEAQADWKVEGTTLIANKPMRWWSGLTFHPVVGPRYHYKVRIEVPRDGQSPKVGAGVFVGANLEAPPSYFGSVFVYPERQTWVYGRNWTRAEQTPRELNETTTIEVKCWDEEVVVRIGGETVYKGPAAGGAGNNPDVSRIGMGFLDRNPMAKPIRFDSPAVKKLTLRPSELGPDEIEPEAAPKRRESNRPRF